MNAKPYELWVWLITEDDGSEGSLAAAVGDGPTLIMQGRKRETAEKLRPIAEQHSKMTGRPVRLAHLREVDET